MLAPDAFVRIVSALGPRWIRFGMIHHVACAEDGAGLVAWVGGKPHGIAGNPPSVDAALQRLAAEREAAERSGGPMKPWAGDDGRYGLRRAVAELDGTTTNDLPASLE